MLRAELVHAVSNATQASVSPIVIDDVSISEELNAASESVLHITVDLPDGTGPLPEDSYMSMLRSVNQELIRFGEERTPLFRTVRKNEEEPIESELAGTS